jgi:hypothetical protein
MANTNHERVGKARTSPSVEREIAKPLEIEASGGCYVVRRQSNR